MRVCIYAANINDLPTETGLYKSLINHERLIKAQRFYQHNDRQLCLGAGLLLALVVRARYPQAKLPVKLEYGTDGKPALENYKDFHFNISHSGNWVVCAVAPAPIGVDIEKVQRDMSDVARHYFSIKERAYMASLPQSLQLQAFYDFWVLKESYMKATGQGFKISLEDLHVELNPLPPKAAYTADFRLRWNDGVSSRHSGQRAGISFFRPLLYYCGESVGYSFRLCEFFDTNYRLAFAVKSESEQMPSYSLKQVDCRAFLSGLTRDTC